MSIIPGTILGSRRRNNFYPFSVDVWDPFETALSFLPQPAFHNETTSFFNARIDWKETPEAHVYKADLPGFKIEEVKVQVEDGRFLHISGERNVEKEEKNDRWHRVERSSGKFLRQFRLPDDAKADKVKANMENGVLIVTVPKDETRKLYIKEIPIRG